MPGLGNYGGLNVLRVHMRLGGARRSVRGDVDGLGQCKPVTGGIDSRVAQVEGDCVCLYQREIVCFNYPTNLLRASRFGLTP